MKGPWAAHIDAGLQQMRSALGEAFDPNQALANLKIWVGTSKSDAKIIEISKILREIFEGHGAIVLPQPAVPTNVDDLLVQEQLRRVDLVAMLAITPGVSAEALEICATDRNVTDKMIVYMPEEYRTGFIFDLLTRKYKARVQTFPLKKLETEHDPNLCGKIFWDAVNIVGDKLRKEKLRPCYRPRIGIITALPKEFQAAKRILQNAELDSSRVEGGIYKEYIHGSILAKTGGSHPVVLAMAGKGNNKAAIRAAQLIEDFRTIQEIFMVGIAAGVPNPKKPAEHVRLGDVVVCDDMGVVQYDMTKKKANSLEHVHYPRAPDADWTKRMMHYLADPPQPPKYWSYIDQVSAELGIKRPAYGPLKDSPWKKNATPHPKDLDRMEGKPKLYMGAIGSANMVLKSAKIRNELREKFKVKAIEMEGSGISDAAWEYGTGYMVIRGISDYANDGKNDKWHGYASVAAAAFARELIETMPVPEKVP